MRSSLYKLNIFCMSILLLFCDTSWWHTSSLFQHVLLSTLTVSIATRQSIVTTNNLLFDKTQSGQNCKIFRTIIKSARVYYCYFVKLLGDTPHRFFNMFNSVLSPSFLQLVKALLQSIIYFAIEPNLLEVHLRMCVVYNDETVYVINT
jgi:hypothetical protein